MATSAAKMRQQLGDMSNRIESLTRTRDSPSTVMGPAPCTACGQVAGRSFLHIPLPSCPSVHCPTLIAFFSAPNPPSSTPPTHQSTHPQVTQPSATATPSPTGPAGTANPPPHSPINRNHHPQRPPCLTRCSASQASRCCVQMGQRCERRRPGRTSSVTGMKATPSSACTSPSRTGPRMTLLGPTGALCRCTASVPLLQGNSSSSEYAAAVRYLQSEANYRGSKPPLTRYKRDKAAFMEAYSPDISRGHMALFEAIQARHEERGELVRCPCQQVPAAPTPYECR